LRKLLIGFDKTADRLHRKSLISFGRIPTDSRRFNHPVGLLGNISINAYISARDIAFAFLQS